MADDNRCETAAFQADVLAAFEAEAIAALHRERPAALAKELDRLQEAKPSRCRGSAAYWRRRLKDERPDLFMNVQRGRLSPHKAAVLAGWRTYRYVARAARLDAAPRGDLIVS